MICTKILLPLALIFVSTTISCSASSTKFASTVANKEENNNNLEDNAVEKAVVTGDVYDSQGERDLNFQGLGSSHSSSSRSLSISQQKNETVMRRVVRQIKKRDNEVLQARPPMQISPQMLLRLRHNALLPQERLLFASSKPPPFFILGSATCSDNDLYNLLTHHPQVLKMHMLNTDNSNHAMRKEPHFFADSAQFEQGIANYEARMPTSSGSLKSHYIDASPGYLMRGYFVTSRVLLAYGQKPTPLKLIVVLCEPIGAAYSMHEMQMKEIEWKRRQNIEITGPIHEESYETRVIRLMDSYDACAAQWQGYPQMFIYKICTRFETDSLLTRYMYDPQLEYWRRDFPEKYFCILHADLMNLDEDRQQVMELVRTFLGLEAFDWSAASRKISAMTSEAKNADLPLSPSTLQRLQQFFSKYGGTNHYNYVMHNQYWGCKPHDGDPITSRVFS